MFKWSQETAAFLSRETGMKFPPLNYPPILLDVTKSLYLPRMASTVSRRFLGSHYSHNFYSYEQTDKEIFYRHVAGS